MFLWQRKISFSEITRVPKILSPPPFKNPVTLPGSMVRIYRFWLLSTPYLVKSGLKQGHIKMSYLLFMVIHHNNCMIHLCPDA